jgi:hypothetical protein
MLVKKRKGEALGRVERPGQPLLPAKTGRERAADGIYVD